MGDEKLLVLGGARTALHEARGQNTQRDNREPATSELFREPCSLWRQAF
jgi:hypothetical protein